jgi:hypothetical protein
LSKIKATNAPGHQNGGHVGVLVYRNGIIILDVTYFFYQAHYPAVAIKIKDQLLGLHENGVGLSLISVHDVIVATFIQKQPEIMEHVFKDGLTFHASDSFVRKWLHSANGLEPLQGYLCCPQAPR